MIVFRQKEYGIVYKAKKALVKFRQAQGEAKNVVNTAINNPGGVTREMIKDTIAHPVNTAVSYSGMAVNAPVGSGMIIGRVTKPVTDKLDKPIQKYLKTDKAAEWVDNKAGNKVQSTINKVANYAKEFINDPSNSLRVML